MHLLFPYKLFDIFWIDRLGMLFSYLKHVRPTTLCSLLFITHLFCNWQVNGFPRNKARVKNTRQLLEFFQLFHINKWMNLLASITVVMKISPTISANMTNPRCDRELHLIHDTVRTGRLNLIHLKDQNAIAWNCRDQRFVHTYHSKNGTYRKEKRKWFSNHVTCHLNELH